MPKKREHRQRQAGVVDRRLASGDKPLNGITSNRVVDDPDTAKFRADPDSGKLIAPDIDPATLQPRQIKTVVTASLRGDPLARLHKRHHIGPAEYAAGDWIRAQLELLGRGALRGVDIVRPYVDGGSPTREPISGAQQRAGKAIVRAHRTLGREGFALVYAILGERKYIEQVATEYAAARGTPSERDVKYLGRRFRECLNTLAHTFGFATRAPRGKAPRDSFREEADALANVALRRAMVAAGDDIAPVIGRRIDASPLRLEGIAIAEATIKHIVA